MVKNLPTNAGDRGSISDLGRFHMPQSSYAHAPQLLSLCSGAGDLQLLSPHASLTKAHMPCLCSTRKAITMRSLHIATREQPPLSATGEKPTQQ